MRNAQADIPLGRLTFFVVTKGQGLSLPAVQCYNVDRTDANTHAPVGADASVRPAVCTCKSECTPANPHTVCRGRCRALPVRLTTVFTKRYGKPAAAQRADRGVRPYRTLCVFADGACNFAVAFCRGERGIDPYGHFTLSAFVVRFCSCVLRGRRKPCPTLRRNRAIPEKVHKNAHLKLDETLKIQKPHFFNFQNEKNGVQYGRRKWKRFQN